MQKIWISNGLNEDNFSTATAEAMREFAIKFGDFIGNMTLPEYSASTGIWRWWNNSLRGYQHATTEELLIKFITKELLNQTAPTDSGDE